MNDELDVSCTGYFDNGSLQHDGDTCPVHEGGKLKPIQMQLFEVDVDGNYKYYQSSDVNQSVAAHQPGLELNPKKEKEESSVMSYGSGNGSLSAAVAQLNESLEEVSGGLEIIYNAKNDLEEAEGELESLKEELESLVDTLENLSGVSVYIDTIDVSVDF